MAPESNFRQHNVMDSRNVFGNKSTGEMISQDSNVSSVMSCKQFRAPFRLCQVKKKCSNCTWISWFEHGLLFIWQRLQTPSRNEFYAWIRYYLINDIFINQLSHAINSHVLIGKTPCITCNQAIHVLLMHGFCPSHINIGPLRIELKSLV